MKIKEVIKKTELTDKAIRLYIENGLVAPSIDESYSGRKSIDFSDDDVERLINIALLRKAGFSIADIKEIIESDEKAKNVVERFIEETENNIQHETEIIEKLRGIPAENGISMKTICESLSKAVEKKQVPKEDMKLSALERTIRGFFCTLGGLGMLVSVVGFIVYEVIIRNEFRFTTYNTLFLPVIIYSSFILMFVLSFVLLKTNMGQNFSSTKKSIRYMNSIIIPISYVILLFLTFVTCFFAWIGGACSKTENPKNYLMLDSWVENWYGHEISKVFPTKISETADNESIKYYYEHGYTLDPFFEIIAEWKLPKDEYENAKKQKLFDKYFTFNTENWNIIYYCDYLTDKYIDNYNIDTESDFILKDTSWFGTSHLIIFAYNDKDQKVRYIVASNMFEPTYQTLEW